MHQHNHTKTKTLKLWNYYSASEKQNAAAYKHVLENVFNSSSKWLHYV